MTREYYNKFKQTPAYEQALARRRERYAANPEKRKKVQEESRRWRAENRERSRAAVKDWRKRNPIKTREIYLRKSAHGATLVEYQEMLTKANHCCEICGGGGRLCVDHNHETGKLRGILCNKCNMALGGFQDSEDLLIKAQKYLEVRRG